MTESRFDFPNRPGVSIETMMKAISSQAALIPGVVKHVRPQVAAIVSQLDAGGITNIFTTGCGDSHFAAVAARLAFEKYSGYRTEAIEALEFSRYTVDYVPEGSLVISISSGGTTSRPLEAVIEANRMGATTIAITGTPDSPIGEAADYAILQNERDFRVPAPPGGGTFALGNYFAAMLALYLLAVELGGQKGLLTANMQGKLLQEIERAPEIIRASIEANDSVVRDYASSVKDTPAYHILGGGPNYATAMFIAAKLFEMPQRHGVPQELEEWAHLQYFVTRPGTQVMVVVPPGNSVDRAREQMQGAKDMGAYVVAICDKDDAQTASLADLCFPMPGELQEEFSPLTYCVPGELFAVHLCAALDKPAFAFISEKQYEVNYRQVKKSHLRSST